MGSLVKSVLVALMILSLTGCLSRQLKDLNIRQLESELVAINKTQSYLKSAPTLNRDYDGEVFISSRAFNIFLAGIQDYEISLKSPEGAKLVFKQSQLDFRDGFAGLVVDAHARDRSNQVEIALRLGLDLLFAVDQEKSALSIRPLVKEILPDVRLSIFRWSEFWFTVGLWLQLKAQEYLDSLPTTSIPLQHSLELGTDMKEYSKIDTKVGFITIQQKVRQISVSYKYRIIQAVALQDGIHLFFVLEQSAT